MPTIQTAILPLHEQPGGLGWVLHTGTLDRNFWFRVVLMVGDTVTDVLRQNGTFDPISD